MEVEDWAIWERKGTQVSRQHDHILANWARRYCLQEVVEGAEVVEAALLVVLVTVVLVELAVLLSVLLSVEEAVEEAVEGAVVLASVEVAPVPVYAKGPT